MPEDRETAILERLRDVIKSLKYGELVVRYTIHDSKIVKGEITERKESLG